MKIILSPAKKMIVDTDNIAPVELPAFIDKTAEILSWMKSKSKEELAALVNLSPTHVSVIERGLKNCCRKYLWEI